MADLMVEGEDLADAAELVGRMADRYRLHDALRRADTLARTGPPVATMTDRQPTDLPRRAICGRRGHLAMFGDA